MWSLCIGSVGCVSVHWECVVCECALGVWCVSVDWECVVCECVMSIELGA